MLFFSVTLPFPPENLVSYQCPGAPLPLACVFSPDGRQIAFTQEVPRDGTAESYPQIFTIAAPRAGPA